MDILLFAIGTAFGAVIMYFARDTVVIEHKGGQVKKVYGKQTDKKDKQKGKVISPSKRKENSLDDFKE